VFIHYPEHQNHAHLGTLSMFCVRLPPTHLPNIKKCPDGYGFDAQCLFTILSTTSLPAKHRKNAQIGMVLMFSICLPSRTSKPCPPGHVFDARRVCTISLPAEHQNYAQMCSARVHYILTSWTSKPCSDAHVFDVQRVSTTIPPAEPQNYCHLGTFLMFGVCPRAPNFGTMPGWA